MDKKKILLIDDEEDFTEMAKNRLEKVGYEVYTAADGAEGLKKFAETKPDLVLLDIIMPGMDGLEVLHRIRSRYPEAKDVPVIMLTAKRDTESIFKSRDYRATDYIMKPFKLEELLVLVNKYIKIFRGV